MCSTLHYSSKSFTSSFLVLLVLVLLPFIPSQPPHFVKQSIFTAFWELFHLFLVGIVVCYGLFSTTNGKVDNVSQGSDISASYVSGISYVSSFFENGVGNTYGYGERFDFEEFKDSRSSKLRNGVCEENVGKNWNSKHFVCESMGFVANGICEVKLQQGNGYKPLNLPVRSLKSKIIDSASNQEDTHLEASDKIKKVKFRGLVPINLDEKFRETVSVSPVPWGSRSERMDVRENVGNVKPAFVGETELVRPKLPTVKPLSPSVLKSEMEEFERKESLRVSLPPASKSSQAPLKSKPSSSSYSSQRFSTEVGVEENNENKLKSFSKGETEDLLNKEIKGVVSLNFNPATFVEARSMSGSFSEITLENNSKNDFKGLRKGQKAESMHKQNKCTESLKSDLRHAHLVKEQLQIGSTSKMTCYERSSDNNLTGSVESEKGDLLERENMSYDFWNLDMNASSLVNVDGSVSTASSSEKNGEKKSEIASIDFGNRKKEDLRSRNSLDSLKPDVIPKNTMKCLTRGKSVRTIRSNELSVEFKRNEEVYLSHTVDKFVKHCDEDEAELQKKSDWRDGLIYEAEHSRKNRDKPSDMKNSKLRKNRNGERQKNGTRSLVKSKSIFLESENFQVIADKEEHKPCVVGDTHIEWNKADKKAATHIELNEVDKKADEFIAKFREQIRLQKVASKRESNFL